MNDHSDQHQIWRASSGFGAINQLSPNSQFRKKRWRRESNPCARLCRPLPHHSATPPQGLMHLHLRADDGIRTRDPHLGKVMRYQLRYVRAQRTRSSPGAKHDDSPRDPAHTNPLVRRVSRLARVLVIPMWRVLRTPARASLRRRSPSAPVPWLSGRASASHAEGRWFDPSRDHKCYCR